MKNIILAAVAVAVIGLSNATPANATTVVAPPQGATLLEISRWIDLVPHPDDHFTAASGNQYWNTVVKEGPLGFVSTTQFSGSHPLYTCFTSNYEQFTSSFANCEGTGSTAQILGWVSSTHIEGTVPLYRCRINREHFDSLAANCEGQIVEGVLGFVFA